MLPASLAYFREAPMSQSNSLASVDTNPTIDIVQGRFSLPSSGSRTDIPYNYTKNSGSHFHKPKSQQTPSVARHYATLQEHADYIARADYVDVDAPTPRHEIRRGSFAWGLQTAHDEEAPTPSRNPMMPQQMDNSTPPTIEELVRRTTVDDDISSARKSSSAYDDAVFSRPSTTRSSTSGTEIDTLTRTDTGKSSFGGLARSMTRNIPDIKMHYPSAETAQEKMAVQSEEQSEFASSAQGGKRTRKLSFQLPSGLKTKNAPVAPQKSSTVIEEFPNCESYANASPQDTPIKCGGLAARRQIKMDLTLPIGLPDLQDCNGVPPGILSSIISSRPRSPKTPWVREKELNWSRDAKSQPARSAPIMEENQTYVDITDTVKMNDVGLVLKPGQKPTLHPVTMSLPMTPDFVRRPQKIRDRCYISRPTVRRNKSGGPSTSESDFGSTPDGHWSPEVKEGMTEQEVRAQSEFVQLAKIAKTARSRRWPWNKSKASGSDEQGHDERSESCRSISANLFKRSNRFPETPEREKKEKKLSKSINSPWRRKASMDRPPLPSASLANMSVPPTFIPPGCEKVPTPPNFDAASEIRGKLANFFFESGGFSSTKRNPKASPGGYWDSDAVLMSMQTDLRLTNDEDDEEGPEGRPPTTFHFGPVNDTPGIMASPGLTTGPDGYLSVKGFSPGITPLTPSTAQDSWFRMHFGDHKPSEESLTAAALKEIDERRKFEWLVPEHLPNSPLCPLHVKYVGPSKGLCYWHGRKSNGWGVELGRDYISHPVRVGGGSSAGWDTGRIESPKDEKRKRRLVSLSNP